MKAVIFFSVLLINSQILFSMANPSEELLNAAKSGNLNAAKKAIEEGANVNAQNKQLKTALKLTILYNHPDITEFLLKQPKVDIEIKDESGTTSLITAASLGRENTVKLLIEKGSDVNSASQSGSTALIVASDQNYPEIVKLLIQNGANVNTKDKNRFSAIMAAAKMHHVKIVKMLAAAGARIKDISSSQFKPEMHQAAKEVVDVLNGLKQLNSSINALINISKR